MFSKSKKYLAKGLAFVLAIGGFSTLSTSSALTDKETTFLKLLKKTVVKVYPNDWLLDGLLGCLSRHVRSKHSMNILNSVDVLRNRYPNVIRNHVQLERMLSFVENFMRGFDFQNATTESIANRLFEINNDDDRGVDELRNTLLKHYTVVNAQNGHNDVVNDHANNNGAGNNNANVVDHGANVHNVNQEIHQCSICFEDIRDNQAYIIHGNGNNGHETQEQLEAGDNHCHFHKRCINRWLRNHLNCPNCRRHVEHVL